MQEALRLIGELRRGLDLLEKILREKETLRHKTVPDRSAPLSLGIQPGGEYDPRCIMCPLWQDGICGREQKESCPLTAPR